MKLNVLQAMAIDGPSPKRLLNLVSFSSMREIYYLLIFTWIEQLHWIESS